MIPEVLELLAHACVEVNQLERARDAYKELIELEPESAAHLQGYRQVCARLDPCARARRMAAPPRKPGRTASRNSSARRARAAAAELPARGRRESPPPLPKPNFASRSHRRRAASPRWRSPCNPLRGSAPKPLLGLLYRQAGDSARAARCYAAMQRALQKLGETQAAEFYASLAGSGQTTTWEAKGSEFTPRDFDLAPLPRRRWPATPRKSISPASGNPSFRNPPPSHLSRRSHPRKPRRPRPIPPPRRRGRGVAGRGSLLSGSADLVRGGNHRPPHRSLPGSPRAARSLRPAAPRPSQPPPAGSQRSPGASTLPLK